jgi:hypothetical protein
MLEAVGNLLIFITLKIQEVEKIFQEADDIYVLLCFDI